MLWQEKRFYPSFVSKDDSFRRELGLKAMLPELSYAETPAPYDRKSLNLVAVSEQQKKPSLYSFMNLKDLSRLENLKLKLKFQIFFLSSVCQDEMKNWEELLFKEGSQGDHKFFLK